MAEQTDTRRDTPHGDPDVSVHVARSGGIAGTSRRWQLEAFGDDADDLRRLVDRCPWRECEHADAPRASRGADRFTWEISARTSDGVRSALIDESGAAGAWRALIDAVRSGSDGDVRTR